MLTSESIRALSTHKKSMCCAFCHKDINQSVSTWVCLHLPTKLTSHPLNLLCRECNPRSYASGLKGGGHGKITADFFGQIYSLNSVKTESVILKFLEFTKVVK